MTSTRLFRVWVYLSGRQEAVNVSAGVYPPNVSIFEKKNLLFEKLSHNHSPQKIKENESQWLDS